MTSRGTFPWLTHHVQSVIRKLQKDIKPLTERIMINALNLIKSAGKHSTILEDSFLLLGTMASGEPVPLRLSDGVTDTGEYSH